MFVLTLLLVLARPGARAQGGGEEKWRIWLEPRFMHAPVSMPIPGSERTDIAGGVLESGALESFTRADLERRNLSWEKLAAQARANATADLAQLKPVYVRNRQKVIEYAEIRGDKPVVASAVFAPGFLDLFAGTMGPAILLVVPNRQTAYVFPKLASNYQEYSPMILRAYRETSSPVSLEVFELSADGVQAIGSYSDPGRP